MRPDSGANTTIIFVMHAGGFQVEMEYMEMMRPLRLWYMVRISAVQQEPNKRPRIIRFGWPNKKWA